MRGGWEGLQSVSALMPTEELQRYNLCQKSFPAFLKFVMIGENWNLVARLLRVLPGFTLAF